MTRRTSLLAAIVACLATAFPPHAGAATQRLILTADQGSFIRVEGLYPPRPNVCPSKQPRPLQAKYRDKVELRVGGDGTIQIINTLSFSNYLRGLAEVPAAWPLEALRAQAIAARSYAIAGMRNQAGSSRTRGYDICASDQCQVYRGATVELGAFGERWVQAVESTKGRIMTYNGGAITAYYFSTSTGRTRRAFPGGTPSPYLRSVDGQDDDAPLARWTAPVTLRDLAAILRADGLWPGGTISRVSRSGDTVSVSGAASRSMTVRELRSAINSEGPCLFPNRYPNPTGTQSGGRLPLAVPSSTYSLEQDGARIVIRGRGWGHDVGMSQYGAKALAEQGRKAPAILGYYYAHDQIRTITEPDPIRVLAAEDLQKVRIAVEGRARITTGTGSVLAPGRRFEVRLRDGDLRVLRGRGPSLKPVLEVTPATTGLEVEPGTATVAIPFDSSRSVRVRVTLTDEAGTAVVTTAETSFESGDNSVDVALRNEAGAPLAAGEYTAVIEAYDGLDRIRSQPVAVVIAAASPTPQASGADDDSSSSGSAVALIAAVVIFAVAAVGLLARLLASRR